ncbi:hypothetical protein, partial [Raoultella ornithinolytica]|uniref:hypothetical protein n=1 Tax=Raoultella ornithinolytica TaxID=54291 RepID=UPI001CCCA74A
NSSKQHRWRRETVTLLRWPAIRQGEEMIRKEDKPAWRNFWLKVVPFLVVVVAVSVQCWGGK